MDSRTRLLFWLLTATKGGPTRVRILSAIKKKPMNLRRLSLHLNLDYKTVKAHIDLLLKNGIIDMQGRYGAIYFISPEWEQNDFLMKILGEKYEKRE